jgi:hypothetical protein
VRLVALVLAGCGSGAALPDAACGDAALCADACPATFSGNFADHSLAAANCARLDPALELSIASPVIGAPLAISLDLGAAPAAGPYSSETVAHWSAVQARSIGDGACVYSAGDEVVPIGSFTLDLADPVGPHGTLAVELTVHAVDGTRCGAGDREHVEIVF